MGSFSPVRLLKRRLIGHTDLTALRELCGGTLITERQLEMTILFVPGGLSPDTAFYALALCILLRIS
jgi:hypothetical protein